MKLAGAVVILGAALLLLTSGGGGYYCVGVTDASYLGSHTLYPWDILMQVIQVRVTLSLCSRLWHLPSYKRGCSSIFKWNFRRVC